MNLKETVDYLSKELDRKRSDHVREVGQSVAELRDSSEDICQVSLDESSFKVIDKFQIVSQSRLVLLQPLTARINR
jgi:hypothetical protein